MYWVHSWFRTRWLRKGEIISEHILRLNDNAHNGTLRAPFFYFTQFLIQDEWLWICGRSQTFVEWIHNIFSISIYNSDIRRLMWETVRQHHIVINFTVLTPHFDFDNTFDFKESFLLTILHWIKILILN